MIQGRRGPGRLINAAAQADYATIRCRFLAPEVVLLLKARPGLDRPGTDNDQRDLEAALPLLSVEQRSWLKDAIERPSWLKDAIEGHSRPPRQHRWTAELATDPHRPA